MHLEMPFCLRPCLRLFTQQHIQIEFAHHLNTKWLHVVVPGKISFVRSYVRPQGWLWMTIHVGRPLGRISHQIHVASATTSSSTTSHKVACCSRSKHMQKFLFFFLPRGLRRTQLTRVAGKWEMEMPQLRFHRKGGRSEMRERFRGAALQRGYKKGLVQELLIAIFKKG